MIQKDRYIGCFLGLALGDSLGAPYEGGFVERQLWKLIGKTADGKFRFTDDTQMSIDLAKSFLENNDINQDHLATTFAKSYRWSRGYGPSASKLLKKIRNGAKWHEVNRLKYKEGSLGNGAAMRAPIVSMCYSRNELLLKENVVKTAEITHAHPLAIEGAQLIAYVTSKALIGQTSEQIQNNILEQNLSTIYRNKIELCVSYLKNCELVRHQKIYKTLGNGITAIDSCVTAIYFGLKYQNQKYENLLNDVLKIGGDVDTITSMASAIWGASNGSSELLLKKDKLENSEVIISLAEQLYDKTK